MRVIPGSWIVFLCLVCALLPVPSAVGQECTIDDDAAASAERRSDFDRKPGQPSPPAPPLAWAEASIRGPIPAGERDALSALDGPGLPTETTVVLPLSAGLSIVSLPLRVPSEKLSDIFPNLPEGSRAWIWDVSHQRFVEGFDNQLPLGHACWLYVPVPVLLVVTGKPNQLQQVSFDLERGWNLIGVPYDAALLRSQQHVYVHWARTPFNDAVAAGNVGPLIYSFDANGYETVAEDGSFEPLHGYWVYASGAELLDLKRPGFSDPDIISMIPWGSVVSTVGSLIMTQMGYGDSAKLNQILGSLDKIAQTQAAIDAKLDTVLTRIDVNTTKLLQAIDDATYVAPVQKALSKYYDQKTENQSLAWFVAQAKAGVVAGVTITNGGSGYTSVPTVTFAAAPQGGITAAGTATVSNGAVDGVKITIAGSGYTSPPAVTFTGGGGTGAAGVVTLGATMASRSNFARTVLNDPNADFIGQFNSIKDGIAPISATNQGIFENFAEYVRLTSTQYDLTDQYNAMETYFSTLLGMQIKCATLIMNAYDQLGNDPDSKDGYTPQTAARWKKDVFDPVMKAETERFLQAVEGLAVKKLPVPATWSDPAVKVPDHVQVVMGLADLYVMETLRQIYPQLEPPGVRVRIILNPGAGADLPKVTWGPSGVLRLPHITTLPSFDIWETYPGTQDYDDWILPRDSNTRAFKVTRNWKMVRVILPVTAPGTFFTILMGESAWWSSTDATSTVSASRTESGTLFGSITLARRPTTRDVFDPCIGGWPFPTTNVTHNCCCWPSNDSCDQGGVVSGNCNKFYFQGVWPGWFGTDPSWMTVTYQFAYQGDVPKAGTWNAQADGTFTRAHSDCDRGILYYKLLKGKDHYTQVDSTLMNFALANRKTAQTVQVTWEPGQTYTFQALIQTGVPADCERWWKYGGAAITFP
jgi:hypothetical protein